jgi:hypothetical protein
MPVCLPVSPSCACGCGGSIHAVGSPAFCVLLSDPHVFILVLAMPLVSSFQAGFFFGLGTVVPMGKGYFGWSDRTSRFKLIGWDVLWWDSITSHTRRSMHRFGRDNTVRQKRSKQ